MGGRGERERFPIIAMLGEHDESAKLRRVIKRKSSVVVKLLQSSLVASVEKTGASIVWEDDGEVSGRDGMQVSDLETYLLTQA